MIDDRTFLLLNAVYLKKMATAAQAAGLAGVDPDTALDLLAQAAGQGWLMAMEELFLLEPDGRQVVLSYYNDAYGKLRADARLDAWYQRFETLNAQFIQQVSEWQGSGDERARGRLLRSVERLAKALADIVPIIPRYEGYVRRFEQGLALVDQGRIEYIANPRLDSLHNVWFEFHEDILSVLGRPRDA